MVARADDVCRAKPRRAGHLCQGAGLTTTTSKQGETAPNGQLIGPGLVVAATGVGAIDLVATLIAGQKYSYALLWAVVVGCLMKIVLIEGAGRWSLATGKTI